MIFVVAVGGMLTSIVLQNLRAGRAARAA
jgi:hypothetical protein